MSKNLSDVINIQRHFLRSVNISLDYGRDDAIRGYIMQPSVQSLLETTANHLIHSQQKAFTWTGPYGGGKSLLALTIASMAGCEAETSHLASEILQGSQSQQFIDYFSSNLPWLVLPLTGTRTNLEDDIKTAIQNHPLPERKSSKLSVAQQLNAIAESTTEYEGVLLIIDELGKYLEHTAHTGGDIGFYQELAETAARCKGKLVVIGILHQAFEQYASRLGTDVQKEWAKVQGRYIDVPLLASTDETLSLIGKAIQTKHPHPGHEQITAKMVQFVPNSHKDNYLQHLNDCWPLHPLSALMLGPASRKRYGQNERTVFSFLTSAEPYSFSQIIKELELDSPTSLYWPYHFWDYLKANFEHTILSSADGRRWSLALDALMRAEAIYPQIHVQIIKTIALLELFRSNLGLFAKTDLLQLSLPYDNATIDRALKELADSSILIFRRHTDSWAIYAGSDFDIDDAIRNAQKHLNKVDLTKLEQTLALPPIIARRHYSEKGAIRWLDRTLVLAKDAKEFIQSYSPGKASGTFLHILPDSHQSKDLLQQLQQELSSLAPKGVLIGTSSEAPMLVEQLNDLNALHYVRSHSLELHTDSVAMRELNARVDIVQLNLTDTLLKLFNHAQWMYQNELKVGNLTQIASEVVDAVYHATPSVLSELVNRDLLSTNAVKAQKDLLRAMLSRHTQENLGFEGMSASAGLYYTTIKTLGMHRLTDDGWQICKPLDTRKSVSAQAMWTAAEELLFNSHKYTTLDSLYQLWSQKPFGLKKGLLPIFSLAFYLANRSHLAVYMDGIFTPDITEATLDEWLQDPKRVSWRFVKLESSEQDILRALADALSAHLHKPINQDPLDSARALVSIVYNIPAWTRRTEQLTSETKKLRQLLLHASDPHKVLFVDIPTLLETSDAMQIAHQVTTAAQELVNAFSQRLKLIESNVLKSLDHENDWGTLNLRGKNIVGVGADFKLEAFIARISNYKGLPSDIEGLLMLAISKPSKDWTDHDLDAGEVQLLQWAYAFRRLEVVAHLRDKPSNRRGIGIIFGNQQTIAGSFDVAEQDQSLIETISNHILDQLRTDQQCKKEVFLAALAEAGARVLQELNEGDSKYE